MQVEKRERKKREKRKLYVRSLPEADGLRQKL